MGRDDSFPALLSRVRTVLLKQYGANAARPFLLLCDLLELLDRDKVDRVVSLKDIDSSS